MTNALWLDTTCNMMKWYGMSSNYDYYTCVHRVLAIGSADTVEGILWKHLPGKQNTDVEAFFAHEQPLTFIPKSITAFFPNVVAISINNTGLKELSSDDFKDFPSLKNLHVNYNMLEMLRTDLFRYNPKLETILVWNNNLKHVGFNLISHLTNLKAAQLTNSPCINFAAENSDALTELSYKLSVYCPPTLEMFKTALLDSNEFKSGVNEEFHSKIDQLQQTLQSQIEEINMKLREPRPCSC